MIPAQAHAKLSGLEEYLVLIISALHESRYFAVMEGRVKIAIGFDEHSFKHIPLRNDSKNILV